jgi:hypothetical protein
MNAPTVMPALARSSSGADVKDSAGIAKAFQNLQAVACIVLTLALSMRGRFISLLYSNITLFSASEKPPPLQL